MMDEINEEYFKDKPYSFGGKYRLYDTYPRKDVDKALKANDTYTKFKRYKRSKTYSPIYVYQKRELFQSDVVFFTRNDLVTQNDRFKYLFTTRNRKEFLLGADPCGSISLFLDVTSKNRQQ